MRGQLSGKWLYVRRYDAGGYRYGFNGKENDNEVKGEGNQQDYGMRIYDPRLGRFLSTDPLSKKYVFYTPYQFSGNKPTVAVDIDGQEDHIYTISFFNKQGKAVFTGTHNEGQVVCIDRNGYEVYDRPERFVAAYNIAFIDGTKYSLRLAFGSYREMQGVKESGFYPQAVSLALWKGLDLGLTVHNDARLGYDLTKVSTRVLGNYVSKVASDATRVSSKLNWAAYNELYPVTNIDKIDVLRNANTVGLDEATAIVDGYAVGVNFFGYATSSKHTYYKALEIPVTRAFTAEAPPVIRPLDAEVKVFENINLWLKGNRDAEGTFNIITDMPVCNGCKAKLEQLKTMYPKIKLNFSNTNTNRNATTGQ